MVEREDGALTGGEPGARGEPAQGRLDTGSLGSGGDAAPGPASPMPVLMPGPTTVNSATYTTCGNAKAMT